MKNGYIQTISEKRIKVNDIIDNYFDSILSFKENGTPELSPEELIQMLKISNPDGWSNALIDFVQYKK